MSVKIGSILKLFDRQKNEFERMALFLDDSLKDTAKKMREALDKFIETGDYSEYLNVKYEFDQITKTMSSRDSFVVFNPDRGSRY